MAMNTTPNVPASIIINLSAHPLTDEQREEIERHTYIEEEIKMSAHCSPSGTPSYIPNLFERIGLTLDEWNTKSIILVLPGLAPLAARVLAHAHKQGGFPKILWLAPDVTDKTRYIVSDIVDLQAVRDDACEARVRQM